MRHSWRAIAFAMSSTLILNGCETMMALGGVKPKPAYDPLPVACKIFPPLAWEDKDFTDILGQANRSLQEVKVHNRVWLELCGTLFRPAQAVQEKPR